METSGEMNITNLYILLRQNPSIALKCTIIAEETIINLVILKWVIQLAQLIYRGVRIGRCVQRQQSTGPYFE